MTYAQIKRIFNGAGLDLDGELFPTLRTIIMTTNHGVDPIRDHITFDGSNELIKIKQYEYRYVDGKLQTRPYSDYPYDVVLSMDEVVGFEFVSAQIGLS